MDHIVEPGAPIQAAIDTAHDAGGGRVVLEPGVHHSGTLYLKSRVELHLCGGARLQGSTAPEAYDDFRDPGFDAIAPEQSHKCLIAAAHAQSIAVTGRGEVNGAGPAFYDTDVPKGHFFAKPPVPRPRLLQLYACRDVRIEGVAFVDSPGWTFWLIDCEDVDIRGLRISGCQQMINNDGIDLDGCRRVTVSDCRIRTGDDCIVVRAIPKGPDHEPLSEGVTVTNCILDSWCQGIRVGCPSDGTIRNCTFSNLVIQGRGNGIHINNPKRYLRPGCSGNLNLHDVLFSNLVIDSGRVPIWINVEEGVTLRRLGGLTFANVRIASQQPIRVEGCAETVIEGVRFSEIRCRQAPVVTGARNVALHQVQIDAAD